MDIRRQLIMARLASVAIIGYQILLLAVVVVRPEIDVTRKPVSEYAIGRNGWIAIVAFLTAAASYASLAMAVRPVVRGVGGRIGLGLLLVCAVGTVGVGVFVADPVTTPFADLSGVGTLHVITGLTALVLLPFAALLITRCLADTGAIRLVGWLPLAGLVGHVLLSTVMPPEGWPPRLLFLTYAIWLVVVATHLTRRPR